MDLAELAQFLTSQGYYVRFDDGNPTAATDPDRSIDSRLIWSNMIDGRPTGSSIWVSRLTSGPWPVGLCIGCWSGRIYRVPDETSIAPICLEILRSNEPVGEFLPASVIQSSRLTLVNG